MKSIAAIVAGVVVVVGVTIGVDALMHATRVFPPGDRPLSDALSALALSYRVVIGVFGAWLTARLAPIRPMWHAMVLGVIGTLAGIAGVVATWNQNLGPHWYAIAVAAFALPQSWLGARFVDSSK